MAAWVQVLVLVLVPVCECRHGASMWGAGRRAVVVAAASAVSISVKCV